MRFESSQADHPINSFAPLAVWRQIRTVVMVHKWLALVLLLGVMVTGMALTLLTPPVYKVVGGGERVEPRISPGAATDDMPRPVGFIPVPVVTTDLASAKMIKYAAKTLLATKISFANEVANLCERVGADIREVVRGFGLDNRIGPRFLNAGVGWGGSCFGKDVSALVEMACEYGCEPQLLRATVEVNNRQRHVAVQKLQELLKIIKGKTIGLLGLAFKPETDDLRDAPALTIAQDLLGMGARVKVYDPIAMAACREQYPTLNLEYTQSATELATDCDAIVIVTEWEEFRQLNPEILGTVMRNRVMIDGRNLLAPEAFTPIEALVGNAMMRMLMTAI